jgi:hypothetical protein
MNVQSRQAQAAISVDELSNKDRRHCEEPQATRQSSAATRRHAAARIRTAVRGCRASLAVTREERFAMISIHRQNRYSSIKSAFSACQESASSYENNSF